MTRGFAKMPKEQRSAISRLGGKAAHKMKLAHEWDSEKARAASLKGHAMRKANKAAIAAQHQTIAFNGDHDSLEFVDNNGGDADVLSE